MDKAKLLEILDKNIDQEGLAKDLVGELIKPWLEGVEAKINSGEIDPLKGTDLDKHAMVAAIKFLKEKAGV